MHDQILLKNFLLDIVPNYNNMYIHDIWNYDLEELENKHNYIQWIFPNTEKSRFNIFCPRVKDETITNNTEIKKNIEKSFLMMLNFYGLSYKDNFIIKGKNYKERSKKWITKNNHNYLRITRILLCLNLFNLNKQANDFFAILMKIYEENQDIISEETFSYWNNANNNGR